MKFITGQHISFINPTGHSQPTAVHGLKSALDGDGKNICTAGGGVSAKVMPFAACSSTAAHADCLSADPSLSQASKTQTDPAEGHRQPKNIGMQHSARGVPQERLTNPVGRTGGGQAGLQEACLCWLCHPQQPCSCIHLLSQKSARGHQAMKMQSEEVLQKLILVSGRLFYLKLQWQLTCPRGQCQEINTSRAGRSSHRLWCIIFCKEDSPVLWRSSL